MVSRTSPSHSSTSRWWSYNQIVAIDKRACTGWKNECQRQSWRTNQLMVQSPSKRIFSIACWELHRIRKYPLGRSATAISPHFFHLSTRTLLTTSNGGCRPRNFPYMELWWVHFISYFLPPTIVFSLSLSIFTDWNWCYLRYFISCVGIWGPSQFGVKPRAFPACVVTKGSELADTGMTRRCPKSCKSQLRV